MMLDEYRKKRNFKKTTEPTGKTSQKAAKQTEVGKLRFVIQFHVATKAHYDFRLEWNGVLLSWAVPKGLSFNPKDKRLAVHVEDHPLDYIDFHGTIPEGNYGAGTVKIFDSGTYVPSFDMEKGLKKGHLKFVLFGKKIKGEWSLVKMDDKNWLIIKSDDEFAKDETGIDLPLKKLGTQRDKTSRADNNKSTLPFKKVEPELALLAESIPTSKDWIFEIKFDGYRVVSYLENGKIVCKSRNGIDFTKKLEKIAKNLKNINAKSFVVDGEVCAFDKNGKSDFGLLLQKIKSGDEDIFYEVFDLLALDGEDLRQKPLIERKSILKRLLTKCGKHLIFCEHINGNGHKCFEFARENGLEGVVAKKSNSTYTGTRNGDWLKIKCYHRQEFVICGLIFSESVDELSSICVGFYEKDKLVYAGRVGTGFSSKERKEMAASLLKLKTKTCHVDVFPNNKQVDAVWVKPKLVAEIQYAEFTKDGVLRQPSFLGIREDKDPKSVVLEKNNGN